MLLFIYIHTFIHKYKYALIESLYICNIWKRIDAQYIVNVKLQCKLHRIRIWEYARVFRWNNEAGSYPTNFLSNNLIQVNHPTNSFRIVFEIRKDNWFYIYIYIGYILIQFIIFLTYNNILHLIMSTCYLLFVYNLYLFCLYT